MSSSIPDDVQQKLKHQFLVIRQQAISKLVSPLNNGDTSNLETFQTFAFELLNEDSWQSKQSAFILCEKLIKYSDKKFESKVIQNALTYFEYEEHRVREAVASCVGECARSGGINVYHIVKAKLFKIINDNFIRDGDDNKDNDASGASSLAKIQANKQKQHTHHHHHDHDHDHDNNKNKKDDEEKKSQQKELKHDTEGWKCLFSAMKTIERIIVGLELQFEAEVTSELLQLFQKSTKHINRFIREVTYYCYAAICNAITYKKLEQLGTDLALIIADGLSDNWSQVRYASSHAVRNFFNVIPDDPNHDKYDNPLKKKYFPILLPPMCINRYYVAAGVRVYSLETWKLLVGNNGRKFVAKYMQYVQKFFTTQATADNHAVREAACHCIAELATKIDHNAVSQYIPGLLDALIACFKDASWPVRDAACVALGDFVSQFPDESVNDLDDLYKLWFEHLSDNIPSVRENSAIALGKILKCEKLAKKYGAEKKAVEHIKQYVNSVDKQKSDDKYIMNQDDVVAKFGGYENVTLFGVAAKRVRDNDPNLHSGQQQYSCGSLAPKLKKATRSGCMDHGFSRDRQPWEYTDGCIHLLRELIVALPQSVYYDEFIPRVIPNVASKKYFAHYNELQQTIWKSIPLIAEAVGKRKFKMYLELILVPMVETLECDNRLAQNAAGNCITFCNKFIGSKFFLPRLKPDQLQIIQNSQFVQL